ncbi:MAG: 50S ribosomal protein L29 [Gammaproteobacteria bacterium]|nr:50S ribosomal protein L29 [Gammaproteobacteria bacterium]
MQTSELKSKTVIELNDELLALRKEQFNLRMQKATGQMTSNHLIKNVRKNIARAKTVLKQKVSESA